MKTVLGIAGSLRRGSYNRSLLRAAGELAPPGLTISVHEGLASIPPFDEDLEAATAGGPEAVQTLRGQIASADALLIATPEYNHSLPGVLKNAIDWVSRPGPHEVLAGKPIAVIGASGGPWGTRLAQAALRQVLYATGSLVLPAPALFVANAKRLFDESGKLVDGSVRERLSSLLAALSSWTDLVNAGGAAAPAPPAR